MTFALPGTPYSDSKSYTADNGVAAESRLYWGAATKYAEIDVTVDSAASGATGTFVPADFQSTADAIAKDATNSGATHVTQTGLTTDTLDGYKAAAFVTQHTQKGVQVRSMCLVVNTAAAQITVTALVWSPAITKTQLVQFASTAFNALQVPAGI